MNLRDLDYLLAVADTGHFGEAAQRCNVSQPTLSTQIRKLEAEIGVALFERGARRSVASVAGRDVIAQARIVVEEANKLRDIARSRTDPLAGTMRLGIIPTSAPYLLPHVVPVLRRHFPELRLHLREAMTSRLLDWVHRGELDAVVLSPPIDTHALELADLAEEAFLIALPEDHALAGEGVLAPERLRGEIVLTLEDGHCLRDQSAQYAERLGLRPDHEVQASSIESLRQMVGAGLGCAVIPAFAGKGAFAASAPIVLRPLERVTASRRLVLAWRRSYPRPDAMGRLANVLRTAITAI